VKCVVPQEHGRPQIVANGVSWSPGKMNKKLKSENMQKEQFSEWRWGEPRHADHILNQIYFRMYHFVVKFSEFSSAQAARGH